MPTARLRGSDVDGSVYDLVRGAGDTLMREVAADTVGGTEFGANVVLTVSRVTLPASSMAGTIAGLNVPATILQLNIPATILQVAGITEVNANAISVSRGSDVVMEGE